MEKKPKSPTEITSIRHKKDINHYGDEVLKVFEVQA